jgi:hypothetical protein
MDTLTVTREDITRLADEVVFKEAMDRLKREMFIIAIKNKEFKKLFEKTKKEVDKEFADEYKYELEFRKKHECKTCGCYPCVGCDY